MLKEVAGDILSTKAEALAHVVAPNDNFANGLALALRERWPAMYKDFRHYTQTFTPKTGELWLLTGLTQIPLNCSPSNNYQRNQLEGKMSPFLLLNVMNHRGVMAGCAAEEGRHSKKRATTEHGGRG